MLHIGLIRIRNEMKDKSVVNSYSGFVNVTKFDKRNEKLMR